VLERAGGEQPLGLRPLLLGWKKEYVMGYTMWKTLQYKWGLDIEHGLYRKDGTFYNFPKKFPCAFFDEDGYVLYDTEKDFKAEMEKFFYEREKDKSLIIGFHGTVRRLSELPSYKTEKIDKSETVSFDIEAAESREQGFLFNQEMKKNIENLAMSEARKHYEEKGYKVTDTSKNHPYDYLLEKDGKESFAEVKGTQSEGNKIILSQGEINFAKEHPGKWNLFIWHNIHIEKKDKSASGGTGNVLDSHTLNDAKLTSISSSYAIS
jgi:hypothetical protein